LPDVLGDDLRAARLAAGLTQDGVADGAGLTREYVSLLELNKRLPTLPVLMRLRRVLSISTAKLVAMLERAEATFPKPPPGLGAVRRLGKRTPRPD
jgi:transcriptional regulator with XRE-family HTH domain